MWPEIAGLVKTRINQAGEEGDMSNCSRLLLFVACPEQTKKRLCLCGFCRQTSVRGGCSRSPGGWVDGHGPWSLGHHHTRWGGTVFFFLFLYRFKLTLSPGGNKQNRQKYMGVISEHGHANGIKFMDWLININAEVHLLRSVYKIDLQHILAGTDCKQLLHTNARGRHDILVSRNQVICQPLYYQTCSSALVGDSLGIFE